MEESESQFFKDIHFQKTGGFTDPEPVNPRHKGPTRIYRARKDGKWFALKALADDCRTNPLFVELLHKEYELGYHLDHPGVVRTLSFEEIEGLGPCIVLEWVEGVTLSKYLEGRNLREKEAIGILDGICAAVGYLHSRQIVHADLKPDNIMITSDGSHVKLIDFGFSDSPSWYLLKSAGGTEGFCAPEQTESTQPVDSKSDIYAIGEIMERMCPGAGAAYKKTAKLCKSKNPRKRPSDALKIPGYINILKRKNNATAAIVVVFIAVFILFVLLTKKSDVKTPVVSPPPAETEKIIEENPSQDDQIIDSEPIERDVPPPAVSDSKKVEEEVDGVYVRYVTTVDKNSSDTVRKKIDHPMVGITAQNTFLEAQQYFKRDLSDKEKAAWRDSVRRSMIIWLDQIVTPKDTLYPHLLQAIDTAMIIFGNRRGL